MISELILSTAVAISALSMAAVGYTIHFARRARKRNAAEACGRCDGPLYAPNAGEGPSLVQGHLYCAHCARHLALRTRVALALAGGHVALLALVAGGVGAAGDVSGLAVGVAAIAETSLLAGGAVYLMKRKNKNAFRELERRGEVLPELPTSAI